MNVANLARVCGTAAATVGAASLAGWSRRPTLQRSDRTAEDLARLDAEFQASLRIQLETARRYDGRFTLTSIQLGAGEPIPDRALLATACKRHIRLLDAVTLIDDALVVLWGSTEQAEAATALERLIGAGVLPPSSLEWTGAATFPADGFTAVSLVEAAVGRIGTFELPGRRERVHLHAVTTAPPSVAVDAGRMNGDGLTAVGG